MQSESTSGGAGSGITPEELAVVVSDELCAFAAEHYPGIPEAAGLLARMRQGETDEARRAASDRLAQLGREQILQGRVRTGGPAALRDGDTWEEAGAAKARDMSAPAVTRFTASDGRYRLTVADMGVTLDLDRLRRESGALVGELVVRCSWAGAATYDGILSAGDLNLSSVRARQDRAKYLTTRARVDEIDFAGLLEELALRVIAAEREGAPLVMLRDLPRPAPDETYTVDGLPLLRRHPLFAYGDGGSAKSYLALYLAGRLEQMGVRCALYDWELAGEDHRERLERIFGADMPAVRYHRCAAPLVYEADRIRRDVRMERLDYVIVDSVAFACDGPPEAAEVAARYFQSLRSLGPVGSLHVAHISKADGSDQKPFGSTFWHNGARATWFVKLAEGETGDLIRIGAYNRKANLGPRRPAVGWEITFTEANTTFKRADPADTAELAVVLTLRQRMQHALRRGSMEAETLAVELAADAETVRRTARRYKRLFAVLPGGKVGLSEGRTP